MHFNEMFIRILQPEETISNVLVKICPAKNLYLNNGL